MLNYFLLCITTCEVDTWTSTEGATCIAQCNEEFLQLNGY